MRRFLLARLGQAAIVILAAVTIVFVLTHAAPGDPFWAAGDPLMSEAMRQQLRADWGFDQPLWRQYVQWLWNFVRGDFGWSLTHHTSVAAVMRAAIPNSLLLAVPAMAGGVIAGVAFGTWKAVRRGTLPVRVADGATLALMSVPDFALALFVLMVFAVRWHIAPAAGMVDVVSHESLSFVGRIGDVLAHLVLPATTLAVLVAAVVSRYQRAAVLTVLTAEYLRTARAMGASERRVLWTHVLRNSLGPVVAVCGLLVPGLMTGTLFIEKTFAWPGLGLTLTDAIGARDYPLVQATVLVAAVLVTLSALAADVIAVFINPRQRLEA